MRTLQFILAALALPIAQMSMSGSDPQVTAKLDDILRTLKEIRDLLRGLLTDETKKGSQPATVDDRRSPDRS